MTEKKKLTTSQLINQASGKTEYYTPVYLLEAAADVMGEYYDDLGGKRRFGLDPASSPIANRHVMAHHIFTAELNGLNHSWTSPSVWLNHPYLREWNKDWINKAVSEYKKGNAKQICMITWSSTSEQWFHPLFEFPIAFLSKRVKFIDPEGILKNGATKSSCITYMGPHVDRFIKRFSLIAHVMLPASWRKVTPRVQERIPIHDTSGNLLVHDIF